MRLRMMRGLLVAATALSWGAGARAAGETVATVNGTPIALDRLVEELLVRHGESVLEDMIRELVVEQAVAAKGITVAEDEVDVEIERERRSFAAKNKKLEDMVGEEYQMSMAGYRSVVRRWLLIRRLILGAESPSDAEVMIWFYQNRERRYDTPAECTVRHIFVALVDPGTGRERGQAEVQGRVEAVRNGVLRGQSFAALALRYSDDLGTRERGGELGTVNERAARTHLEPNFVEAMARLKPGQSGMVNTPKGYHFIQVTARKEGRQARYEDFRRIARADFLEDRALIQREVFLRKLMDMARVDRSFSRPARGEGASRRPIMRDIDGSRWDDVDGVNNVDDVDDVKEKP